MALPPNWAKYTTDEGKDYFHNSITNKTQWEKPEWPGSGPESLSFHSSTSEVYRPTDSDLELQDRKPEPQGRMVPMSEQPGTGIEAPGGKLPTVDTGFGTASASNSEGSRFTGVGSMLASAAMGSDEGAAGFWGITGWALSAGQQLFDISSNEVIKRLKLALVPFKGQEEASSDFRTHPDFYGPFWVATTAILFLAATGNFARLLEMEDEKKFKADYSLVSVAATMIYGLLIGVPLAARLGLYCSGLEVDSINFRQVICVYGYSLTPTIPMSLVCLAPFGFLRWAAVLTGLAISLAFIRGTLWTDLAIEAPSLKWKVVYLFSGAQATIFFVYRIYFFHSVSV